MISKCKVTTRAGKQRTYMRLKKDITDRRLGSGEQWCLAMGVERGGLLGS